jgi:RNA polymerase subunit RPABC4/transcription elongation factor Spt4
MSKSPLKQCKACGGEISKYTPFCRHCGHPQHPNIWIWLLGLFVIVLLAAYTAFMLYCSCQPENLRLP